MGGVGNVLQWDAAEVCSAKHSQCRPTVVAGWLLRDVNSHVSMLLQTTEN